MLDAIKLIESGMSERCDEVWAVVCPRPTQVDRLVRTRRMSLEEANLRIDAQPPQEIKAKAADVVIDSGGELDETRGQVMREWARIMDLVGRRDWPRRPSPERVYIRTRSSPCRRVTRVSSRCSRSAMA